MLTAGAVLAQTATSTLAGIVRDGSGAVVTGATVIERNTGGQLDAVPLATYRRGYYGMFDMLRPGAVISLAWVVWITVLTVALGPALGLL